MKKGKLGFTLIEVSLFLAISGLLFLGVTLGVQTSIRRQRQNDSVQSFAEFLRTVFSEVSNVQNIEGKNGRSKQAIYGKMVTFGEAKNLAGTDNARNEIFVYNVVGDVGEADSSAGALTQLKTLKADVLVKDDAGKVETMGAPEAYNMRWDAQLETAAKAKFTGTLLVVRHPSTGMINTFFTKDVYQVNTFLKGNTIGNYAGLLNKMTAQTIDFCVNSDPGASNVIRRDVRIMGNARGTAGIKMVSDDTEDNKCKDA